MGIKHSQQGAFAQVMGAPGRHLSASVLSCLLLKIVLMPKGQILRWRISIPFAPSGWSLGWVQLQRAPSRCGACRGPTDPKSHGLGAPQLKLEENTGYLREEMMKTGKLQAKEEQTLAEWQVGAGDHAQQLSRVGKAQPGPKASTGSPEPVEPLEVGITVPCGCERGTPERQ